MTSSVHRIDLETGAIFGDVLLALFRCHVAQQNDRALDRVAANIVERPHVPVVETQVRLRLEASRDFSVILDVPAKVRPDREFRAELNRICGPDMMEVLGA